MKNVLSLAHWNLGSKQWQRKLVELEMLTIEKKPDILFITESNLLEEIPDYQRSIGGYEIILPLTMDYLGLCQDYPTC